MWIRYETSIQIFKWMKNESPCHNETS